MEAPLIAITATNEEAGNSSKVFLPQLKGGKRRHCIRCPSGVNGFTDLIRHR
jgi:hypothetical protein